LEEGEEEEEEHKPALFYTKYWLQMKPILFLMFLGRN